MLNNWNTLVFLTIFVQDLENKCITWYVWSETLEWVVSNNSNACAFKYHHATQTKLAINNTSTLSFCPLVPEIIRTKNVNLGLIWSMFTFLFMCNGFLKVHWHLTYFDLYFAVGPFEIFVHCDPRKHIIKRNESYFTCQKKCS